MLSHVVKVSSTLVCEFYASMYGLRDGTFRTMLRGEPILVTLVSSEKLRPPRRSQSHSIPRLRDILQILA
ncbi:hypothetical protein SLA2020_425190 [Shorea laevis]